jgi:hypothetical protein
MGYVPVGNQAKNWMGLTALITGIVGVVMCWCYGFGALPGIAAIIFGALGKKAADEGQATNPGMSKAGLILGICGVIVSIAWFIIMVVLIASSSNSSY